MPQHPAFNVLTVTCPSRTSLARIANKWSALIVIVLADGPRRFGDVRTAVDGISGKVLTETLRDLERDGLVERRVYADVPPRVEYELTALGHTLHAPLRALGTWAEQHTTEVLAAQERYDALPDRRPATRTSPTGKGSSTTSGRGVRG
ncbi:MAG TPA: helix-turn-helix domain-containing protein [Kineosporiaceae bacterium]|nr:helix-turn-helix domain-containing protein [Kineosporiaceae bacterium]